MLTNYKSASYSHSCSTQPQTNCVKQTICTQPNNRERGLPASKFGAVLQKSESPACFRKTRRDEKLEELGGFVKGLGFKEEGLRANRKADKAVY